MKLIALTLAAALATPTMAEAPNDGALTFSGGFDVASAYYFRGYLQENSGLIFQPYFKMGATFVKNDDVTISGALSTWNSFHSEKTGSDGGGAGAWYENDIGGEITFAIGNFTITPIYTLYQYPNGAFETIQEVGLRVGFDDSKNPIIPNFALSPYVGIYYEFDDANGSEDGYLEVGISPGYTFEVGSTNVPLKFPVVLGLSFDDFYVDSEGDNDVLGYLQAGIETSLPLPLPERYGAWNLNVGGYYQHLFAESLELANNDSEHVLWGKIGISFTY
jgi:hypothetical protein